MLQRLFATTLLALTASLAHAAEAGKIIFVAGQASAADRVAKEGAPVQEGELLQTGADGFLYVKTVDDGLFILRPGTRARIVTYHIDAKNPANTRIKLELLSGIARSRSGNAVKLARQNFRFNTPVAAIGVRGTDFTVYTDQDTSRVTVISGGIVVSGFVGACRPEGIGPCEGSTSRELSAAQRGQLLQVQRGQTAPQILSGGTVASDTAPLAVNPIVGAANGSVPAPSLDAVKSGDLKQATSQVPPPPPPAEKPPVVIPPPVTGGGNEPPPVVIEPTPVEPPPVVPAQPERRIVWGRWQPVLDKAAAIDLVAELGSDKETIAIKNNFAMFRTSGADYVMPERGSIGFSLAESEAYVYNSDASVGAKPAALQDAKLVVDFGTRTFTTSFDLVTGSDVFHLRADGDISETGRLFGRGQFSYPTNMAVDGVLSSENGGTAGYLFQSRLDATRTANGALIWRKQ